MVVRHCLFALALLGCASAEPAVVQAASQNLKCSRSEVETTLNRETPVVREYLVGCNFMYARVHCTAEGCHPAEVKPPCIEGTNAPCFKEDPVTLRWVLDEKVAQK